MHRLPSRKRAGDQYVFGLVNANPSALANKSKEVATIETKNTGSPLAWVMGQTGSHKREYVLSVVLAVIGAKKAGPKSSGQPYRKEER